MNRTIEKMCPECQTIFLSHLGEDAPRYCSRRCAGEEAPNLEHVARMLRQREAWKYVRVNRYLNEAKIPHTFEYVLGSYIFDLALTDHGILIEFDGMDHNGVVHSTYDLMKDTYAEDNEWIVLRVSVPASTVIEPESIYSIIEQFCLA